MLLLPDQTYEQYQGEHTLSHSPLSTIKRILNEAAFGPKIRNFTDSPAIQRSSAATNGKKSTNRICISNVQSNLEAFFGVMGNNNSSKMVETKYKEYRVATPEGFEQTADFFNNIPDFNGESLGPFSIPKHNKLSHRTEDVLKECELLLYKYRIRPDFFCRYRKAME